MLLEVVQKGHEVAPLGQPSTPPAHRLLGHAQLLGDCLLIQAEPVQHGPQPHDSRLARHAAMLAKRTKKSTGRPHEEFTC
jgi:hypothetical protein